MKAGTPLKQPKGWFIFLVVAAPSLWFLSIWYKDWPLAIIAALMSIYLVSDGLKLFGKGKADEAATTAEDEKSLKP